MHPDSMLGMQLLHQKLYMAASVPAEHGIVLAECSGVMIYEFGAWCIANVSADDCVPTLGVGGDGIAGTGATHITLADTGTAKEVNLRRWNQGIRIPADYSGADTNVTQDGYRSTGGNIKLWIALLGETPSDNAYVEVWVWYRALKRIVDDRRDV
jgi:hypothetical protein